MWLTEKTQRMSRRSTLRAICIMDRFILCVPRDMGRGMGGGNTSTHPLSCNRFIKSWPLSPRGDTAKADVSLKSGQPYVSWSGTSLTANVEVLGRKGNLIDLVYCGR
ncbi:hypothetical protein J6590_008217 [Homalodisca vitripennis]|nr:hypothetical protein J6590_008217 [Homalodisca vitripennis]